MSDPLTAAIARTCDEAESLRSACAALRAAIARRAQGDPESMHAPLRALTGLEHAALNAPQNKGWLRERQIELRNALDTFAKHALSDADELQLLYKHIAALLQKEPRSREPIRTRPWAAGGRY